MLKRLSEYYEVVVITSPGPELEEICQREGVRAIAVPIERPIAIWKDMVSLARLIRVYYKEKPYIIHGVVSGKASFLSMIAGWLLNVPIRIYTFTGASGFYRTGLNGYILRITYKISCMCATHVLPEGFGVKDDLEKFHVTSKPLKVLGNGNIRGIDANYFQRTSDLTKEAMKIKEKIGGEFVFSFVGRIVRDKGIDELVQAFIIINKSFPSTRLLLIGDYDNGLDPISQESKNEIENNPSVFYAGRQKDVRPWFMASDCFVLPSYREGVPNTVLEAGAMGLPSVVTDINGSREIILNGKNGLIVPKKNMKSLYDAMLQMINKKEETKMMAAAARDLVISRYEQGYVQQCLLDYYAEIIENKK